MTGPATTVWCASFPKSGNTWLRALVSGVVGDGSVRLDRLPGNGVDNDQRTIFREFGLSPSLLDDRLADDLMGEAGAALATRSSGWVFRKTHNAFVPSRRAKGASHVLATPCRAVHVVRDPRAVAVSLAHHMGTSQEDAVVTLSQGPRIGLAGHDDRYPTRSCRVAFAWGSWSDNVRSWTEQDEVPTLLIRYEDLLADPATRLAALTGWLGIPVPPDRIERAVSEASFANLAAQEIVAGFSEASAPDRPFFRRGEAEAWRDELAPGLAERIVSDHGDVMARMGYSTAG
ncbi:MAG: sulfotransferase domain-containing protein [Candidatus Nanopelagicales bacterium]